MAIIIKIILSLYCLLILLQFMAKANKIEAEGYARLLVVSIPDDVGILNVTFKVQFLSSSNYSPPYEFIEHITRPTKGYWILHIRSPKKKDNTFLFPSMKSQGYFINIESQAAYHDDIVRGYLLEPAGNIFKNCTEVELIKEPYRITSACKENMKFLETFDETIDNKWYKDNRHSLYTTAEEFALFNDSPENLKIKDNRLYIKPTITAGSLTNGTLDLGSSCTGEYPKECKLNIDAPYKVLPPVKSAYIHTKDSFNFMYADIQIRAKLPKGDWLFPYIVLKSVTNSPRTEIRIAFARGNEELKDNRNRDVGGRRLYGGIIYWDRENRRQTKMVEKKTEKHFGDDFYDYSVMGTKDRIEFGVDGAVYGEITEHLELFQQNFHIGLGVSVGGHTEFNEVPLKPWRQTSPWAALKFTKDQTWRNTWHGDEALIIDYVAVFAPRWSEL